MYQLSVDEGNRRREGDNSWHSERSPFVRANDEGLALETSAIVSLTTSITLINTQMIHQFVLREDADNFENGKKKFAFSNFIRRIGVDGALEPVTGV